MNWWDKWAVIHEEYGRVYPFHPGLSPVHGYLLAIKHQQRALEGFKHQSDRGGVAEMENNLGCSYRGLFEVRYEPGDFQQAYRHFQHAVQCYRGIKGFEVDRQNAKRNLAYVSNHLHSVEFKEWERMGPRRRKLAVRRDEGGSKVRE